MGLRSSHRPRPRIGLRRTSGLSVMATTGEALSRVTRRPPLLAAGELHFLRSHPLPDASRARSQLGWQTTDVPEGFARALRHFDVLPQPNPTHGG